MEQITITKRDGTTIDAFSQSPFCTPTSAQQSKALMSEDTVKINLRTTQAYSFGKGDKVTINGEEYKIRTQPERTLQSDDDYIHTLTFYGVMYDLMKCQFRNCDANGNSTKAIFDLTYSLLDFAKVIIYNMNRDNPGQWVLDENNVPDTEPITISFSKQNCLQVLQDLCSEDKFNYEFRITQSGSVKTIHIGTFGSVVNPPSGASYFEWGKGNGLFTLTEKKVDDKAIITRLWAEGGTQNIKSGYRDYSDRLQFPYPQRLNRKAHTLKDGTVIAIGTQTIGISDDTKRYMEDTALSQSIGVEEDTQTYDNIYPTRTGIVSALGSTVYEFVDSSMDFDLNATDASGNTLYLIDGTSAKITFITGLLAGQEFELSKYTHSSKTFKIIKYTDERGLSLPTESTTAFRIAVGDKYKITDINMPDSYVEAAEEDLWYEALDYFNEAKQARVNYELTFDRMYFLENMPDDTSSCVFKVGDYVPIKDTRFGIQKNIRIQKVTRNLLLDHDYTLTLSDTTAISVISQAVIDVVEHEKIIEANSLRDLTKAKRGWRTTEELRTMVYDTDGYFDTENIRPNSIDTNMLTVGSKSQQFVLTGVILEANKGGLPNQFSASAGVLSHLTIEEDSVRAWNMSALTATLTDSGGYYIFAKCSKSGTTGVWYITQSQLQVEPTTDPNNYYFLVGIIGTLSEGGTFRDFTATYGFTRINGSTITTGKIVTSDGISYLDLDGNKFKIGNSTRSIAFNESGDGKLILKNVDVDSGAGDPVHLGVYRGVYSSSVVYYLNDEVSYTVNSATATYRYNNATAGSGHVPTDTAYWDIVSQGKGGDFFEYRFAANGSRTTAPALTATDRTPSGWTTAQPTVGSSQYLWCTIAKVNGSDDTLLQNWSTPIRVTPYDGEDGNSPALVSRGTYSSSSDVLYYGNANRVDCVKYNGTYYVARVDAPNGTSGFNVVPTNTNYWNTFGAQFESIATGLLLAEQAAIDNLIVRLLKTNDTGKRIIAENNILSMFDANNSQRLKITGDSVSVDTPTAEYPTNTLAGFTNTHTGATSGSQAESFEIVTFVVGNASTPVTIPALHIDVASEVMLAGGSVNSMTGYLKLETSTGTVISTLASVSVSGDVSDIDYAGGSTTLNAGTYVIKVYVNYDWILPSTTARIRIAARNETTGKIVVTSTAQQMVSVGANGMTIHLGNSFCVIFALDSSSNPMIRLQGTNSSNQVVGLDVSSDGVKVNRGSGWVAL